MTPSGYPIRGDAMAKITGSAAYAADVSPEGVCELAVVRSTVPHARVRDVDVRAASEAPGVLGVLTGADIGLRLWGRRMRDVPILAVDEVRYVGEPMSEGVLDTPLLVWIGGIGELRGIKVDAGGVTVGALTTLAELAEAPEVLRSHPHVATAAGAVGNVRVRSQATVGGALAHADPRQDLPPALMVSAAVAHVVGPEGSRTVPVCELATGLMETVLGPEEVITALTLPPPPPASRSAYARFCPASKDDFPTVSVAGRIARDGSGQVSHVAVALGSVSPGPAVVDAQALRHDRDGDQLAVAVSEAAVRVARPADDRLGSAGYKRHMVGIITRRLMADLLTPAQDDPSVPAPAHGEELS